MLFMLFKPSKQLANIPQWEALAIAAISDNQPNSVELSEAIKVSLSDTLYLLDRLSRAQRIESTTNNRWRLTAEERIRIRRKIKND